MRLILTPRWNRDGLAAKRPFSRLAPRVWRRPDVAARARRGRCWLAWVLRCVWVVLRWADCRGAMTSDAARGCPAYGCRSTLATRLTNPGAQAESSQRTTTTAWCSGSIHT